MAKMIIAIALGVYFGLFLAGIPKVIRHTYWEIKENKSKKMQAQRVTANRSGRVIGFQMNEERT